MQQLAEQAATGSYSNAQRSIMENEFVEMRMEIDRVAGATTFNGIKMLDNSASVDIHFGKLTSDNISITGSNITSASNGLNISGLTISDVACAKNALATLDSAISTKDTARAKFGYKMNRLEGTISVLNITAENLQAAESRVSDVDVATEMAEMTRNQVLAQAGISMLAQANAIPQMALMLLR
jgi:flagellin